MANIGGNIYAVIQKKASEGKKNAVGEAVRTWTDAFNPLGWLGLQSGDSKRSTYNAKLEESTHVFLCDFDANIYALNDTENENIRMILKGKVYEILLIDNPDELDEQLEIYLKKVGAWDGSKGQV